MTLLCVCSGIAFIQITSGFRSVGEGFKPANCLEKSSGTITPQWFKDFAGFEVPPSARNITATCEAFQDYVAYVRLTIDPNDLDRLIASSYVKSALSTTEKPADMTTHYGDMRRIGWDIEPISSYLAGDANVPKLGLHQSILVDTSDAASYIVYIVTFDT